MGKRRSSFEETDIIDEANYMISNKATVRETAKHFGISKSKVFIDLTKELEKIDSDLAKKVRRRLNINKEQRHLRGGMATKLKYLAERISSNLK